MLRAWLRFPAAVLATWFFANLGAGLWVLPGMLLNAPVPSRTESAKAQVRARLLDAGGTFMEVRIQGGEGRPLHLVHLRRPTPKGVVIYLHGFGDDVWGTLGRARALPEWDAVGFTFRGRDADPTVPCTLGAWERKDVVAVFHHLEGQGFQPSRILIAGWSMGAGVALLALQDLEAEGKVPAGALLECPFEDLPRATRDHIRGTLGPWEVLARPAEWCGLWKAGRMARFNVSEVSPVRASARVSCRIALITGSVDRETPLEGVRRIALAHPDLTVVPGAGHCEASNALPGGWEGWARRHLEAWGL